MTAPRSNDDVDAFNPPDPAEFELDDITPAQCDEMRKKLFNAVTTAARDLRAARIAEVKAKRKLKRAKVSATLSSDCPKASRGNVTVAERDAWVDQKVDAEEFAYECAEVLRESAQDYVNTMRMQAMLVTSLSKTTDTAFGMSGRVS